MKRVLSSILGGLFLAATLHAQDLVIAYTCLENGKEELKLQKEGGPGWLYRPVNESTWYLYTNATRIRFDFGDQAKDENQKVIIESGRDNQGIWPHFPDDSAAGAEQGYTKRPDQSFNMYTTKRLYLSRAAERSDIIVKDVILVGSQKLVLWNPPMGIVSHSFKNSKDGRRSADTLFVHPGDPISLDITVTKSGDKIWLKRVFIDDPDKPLQVIDDEITRRSTSVTIPYETTVEKKQKPFDIVLEYLTLDENCQLTSVLETIVHVQTTRRGLPPGLWIPLVCVGGLILLTCLFFAISGKRRHGSKKAVAKESVEPKPETEPTAGVLMIKQVKGKKRVVWLPGEQQIDLEEAMELIPMLSTSKNTEKDWQKGKRDGLTVFKEVGQGEVFDLVKKIKNRYRSSPIKDSVKIKSQYSPNEKEFSFEIIDVDNVKKPLFHYVEHLAEGIEPDVKSQPMKEPLKVQEQTTKQVPANADGNDASREMESRLKQLEEKIKTEAERALAAENKLMDVRKELEEKKSELKASADSLDAKEKEVQTLNNKVTELNNEKGALNERLNNETKKLETEVQAHKETQQKLDQTASQAAKAVEDMQAHCDQKLKEKDEQCALRISEKEKECNARTENWKADKDFFLSGIGAPTDRLVQVADELSRNVESEDPSYQQSLDYILSSLTDFQQKVNARSGEDGEWRKSTNAEAELKIRQELTDLIRINSSWINAIARLFCYSQIKEIGNRFEENGVSVKDIDAAYRDMVALLGRYGITVIVPRILVDFYDDISKKYFGFNNEDNIIIRYSGRDILIQNKEILKIYDMSRIAYYLDGQITKGEIVHY